MNRLRVCSVALALAAIGVVGAAHAQGQSTMPPCLPTAKGVEYLHFVQGITKVPATVSARADSYLVWLCSLPTGYVTEAWLFSFTGEIAEGTEYLAGTLSYAQAQGLCTADCWTLTANEQTFVNGLLAQYSPRAVVAASGGSTTRQVYSATLQPVTGATVAVGTPCNPSLHIPLYPLPAPGTPDQHPLYDVSGQPNASSPSGAPLPAGSFAGCNVTLPPMGISNL